MSRPWIWAHQMDRNVGAGLTKPHKPLKSNDSTYDRMRKVELSAVASPKGRLRGSPMSHLVTGHSAAYIAELKKRLNAHRKWVGGLRGGMQADFSFFDL